MYSEGKKERVQNDERGKRVNKTKEKEQAEYCK